MKVLNMGAGVQTTAILLEFWQDYDLVLMADTGDEHPETYEYIENYLKPFCQSKNLEWKTVKKEETLLEYCLRKKSFPLMSRRFCTQDFKIRVIQKELRKRGATKKNPITCSIGFSLDESHRANFNSDRQYQKFDYPLLDRNLTRRDCYEIIKKHGFPIPIKSGCYYCPYQSRKKFKILSIEHPDLFEKSLQLEEESELFPKYNLNGKYPLRSIVGNQSLDDFTPEESCDSGHCFN
tara:strand:- start:27 stop:734 length:708 start_codon:yes stop_codon:yes gene_type:complete